MPLRADQIISALQAPASAVATCWPLICSALQEFGIDSDLVEVAAAATVNIETARTWLPINERGGNSYFNRMYDTGPRAKSLGNTPESDGDGASYHGRGFVQITGRANYHDMGQALGLPLEEHPDRALEPKAAARILARFFLTHGVARFAEASNWREVRRRVNGGENGLDLFLRNVQALLRALGLPPDRSA